MLKRESCWSEYNGINYDKNFFSILSFINNSFFLSFFFDFLSLFFFLLILERICRILRSFDFRGQSSFALNFQLLRYFFFFKFCLIFAIFNYSKRISKFNCTKNGVIFES